MYGDSGGGGGGGGGHDHARAITMPPVPNTILLTALTPPFYSPPSLSAQFGIFVPPGTEENPEDIMSSDEV